MASQMKRLDTASNNIANGDTPGFKRDIVVTQAFSDVLMRRVRDYELNGFNTTNNLGPSSLGLTINTIHRDFSAGNLTPTDRPLDLALDGSGFFQVAFINDAGDAIQKYTRGGSFTLTADGVLVTLSGQAVLNTSGNPITLPPGNISINPQGIISVNDEVVDALNLVTFEDLTTLRPFGDNLYTTTPESVQLQYAGQLLQGYIETSNVNIVREMVEMITISRAYEVNSRMVAMVDQTLGQAVNDIARR